MNIQKLLYSFRASNLNIKTPNNDYKIKTYYRRAQRRRIIHVIVCASHSFLYLCIIYHFLMQHRKSVYYIKKIYVVKLISIRFCVVECNIRARTRRGRAWKILQGKKFKHP